MFILADTKIAFFACIFIFFFPFLARFLHFRAALIWLLISHVSAIFHGIRTEYNTFTCPWSPKHYIFLKSRYFSLNPAVCNKIFTQKFSLAQRLDSGLRNRVYKKQIYQIFSLDLTNCNPSLCSLLYFYPMQGTFQAMAWPQYLSRKWFWCVSKCFIHVQHSVGNKQTISVVSCFVIHLWSRSLKAASFHQGMLLGRIRTNGM